MLTPKPPLATAFVRDTEFGGWQGAEAGLLAFRNTTLHVDKNGSPRKATARPYRSEWMWIENVLTLFYLAQSE